MLKVKASKRKSAKVKAYKRKLKGGGTIMVKAGTRKASTVKAHTAAAKGKGKKVRNSVGKMVYKGKK